MVPRNYMDDPLRMVPTSLYGINCCDLTLIFFYPRHLYLVFATREVVSATIDSKCVHD